MQKKKANQVPFLNLTPVRFGRFGAWQSSSIFSPRIPRIKTNYLNFFRVIRVIRGQISRQQISIFIKIDILKPSLIKHFKKKVSTFINIEQKSSVYTIF